MTSKIDDGGPAFPLSANAAINPVTDVYGADISSGLTKRDYFAAAALTGIYASQYFVDHVNAYGSSASGPKGSQDGAAKLALAAADALIAAIKEADHA